MTSKGRIAIAGAVLICVAGVLWMAAAGGHRSLPTYTYSRFLDQVHSGRVASVTVMGSNSGAFDATYRLKDGQTARTVLPAAYRDALMSMQDNMVNIEIKNSASGPLLLLRNATPFLVLLAIWICFMIGKFPQGFSGWR